MGEGHHCCITVRVLTTLENLEISGNLKFTRIYQMLAIFPWHNLKHTRSDVSLHGYSSTYVNCW